MIGLTFGVTGQEFSVVDLTDPNNCLTVGSLSAVTIGSASGSFLGSCFDASPFQGKGFVMVMIGSQASVISTGITLQYMDTSVYWSILSVGQADVSGTWAAFTTSPFPAAYSVINYAVPIMVSVDWDNVEGKYVRLRMVNNSLNATRTAMGIAVGRKEIVGS